MCRRCGGKPSTKSPVGGAEPPNLRGVPAAVFHLRRADDELMEFKVWLAGNALSGDVIPGAQGCAKLAGLGTGREFFIGVERSLMMRKPKVDLEMAQFQADLLQSVREMKAGTFARSTQVRETEALQARAKMDLSQPQFAKLLGVSVRTLQEWEQGRKKPTGAAQTLLRVAVQTRQALLSLA
jgi:putative transcriptional regulator